MTYVKMPNDKTTKVYFKTTDTGEPTFEYDMGYPSSHKWYFMRCENNRIAWEDNAYNGKGVFGGKDYFVFVAELNFKKHKSRTLEELREMGINLYNGTQKIFINGKEKELKWPSIVVDDEKLWKNVKPEIILQKPIYPETFGKSVECECDICCMICEM
jgi:hypothetical protein